MTIPSLAWGITFGVVNYQKKRRFLKTKTSVTKLYVESLSGCFEYSKLHEGDFLVSINSKLAPAHPELALEPDAYNASQGGYVSVSVENPEGSDILLRATVIKPRPKMKYQEMGMIVWYWTFLCIKSISKYSIFHRTVLKEGDHITAINDIQTDDMTVEQFAHVMSNLDQEVTITVLRRKERLSGNFS